MKYDVKCCLMSNNKKNSVIKPTSPVQYSGRWGEMCTNVFEKMFGNWKKFIV
jgi:hypothetical protein